jgi:16S rRNA processing protein RimM
LRKISPFDLILVGKVVRPHGTGGSVRLLPYAGSDCSFTKADNVIIKKPSGESIMFPVIDARPHKQMVLMHLEGIDSVTSAETIRGADVFVERQNLSRADDEVFWFELIGLSVFLDTGEEIGRVSKIIPTPAHDIYVVRKGPEEYMIPAVHEVVKEINIRAGRIVVKPPEGLLEINEI